MLRISNIPMWTKLTDNSENCQLCFSILFENVCNYATKLVVLMLMYIIACLLNISFSDISPFCVDKTNMFLTKNKQNFVAVSIFYHQGIVMQVQVNDLSGLANPVLCTTAYNQSHDYCHQVQAIGNYLSCIISARNQANISIPSS